MIITEQAKTEFKKILSNTPESYVRITILGGGCSGFSYNFSTDTIQTGDKLINELVIIDEESLPFLANATVNFVNDLSGKFFKIDIPEAKSFCGCGTSFSI